jgi:hypothetical protein
VELVPCARNKWGNWNEFWFYVAEATVEGHEGLPVSLMCSHYYSAYPPYEVAEEDADEGALRCAAGQSSGRDLVEEFVAYGVWPLAHGWALGEVCPRQMPFHGGRVVRSPAFALNLRNRDPAAFVRDAEGLAVRLVGRYVPRTEGQRSFDIRGSNERLNRVFELNQLPYDGYPGQDEADRRGKKPAVETGGDPALVAAASSKKRKLGTAMGRLGVSDSFARDLMRTCAAPGERMSSPELRESSARMLRVTGGCWPKNIPIPCAAEEDCFTSRMVHRWKVFPYGRNIGHVVWAVMDKDRQGAARKRQATVRVHEARPKRQRGTAKAEASGGGKPPLPTKVGASAPGKAPETTVGAGGPKLSKVVPSVSGVAEAAKAARSLPPPGKRVADFGTEIDVDDYLGGKSI